MAKSIEGFYQESGRCGRDGKPALSLLYFSKTEAGTFSFLIQKNGEKSKKENAEELTQNDLNGLQKMIEYSTGKSYCTR